MSKVFKDLVQDLIDNSNDSLSNLREVSVNEFMMYKAGQWIRPVMQGNHRIHEGNIQTPYKIQILLNTNLCDSGRLDIFSDGTCYFICGDYRDGNWVPRLFMFDVCNHEYKVLKLGRCLNRYTCSKCGHIHTIDSGD